MDSVADEVGLEIEIEKNLLLFLDISLLHFSENHDMSNMKKLDNRQ